MKVLKINEELFMWLGICPIDDKSNWRKQAMHYAIGFSVFFLMLMVFLASLAYVKYVKQFFMSDLVGTLYAVHLAAASFCIIASFTALFLYREKTALIIRNLQKICDQSK